jgi:malonyl CoA-acyl carrier protein transacylase
MRHLISVLTSAFLLAGCAVIRDPTGLSVEPALRARETAKQTVVAGSLDDVYRKVLATADAAGWEVFREFPEDHMVVFHKLPGAVDTTQVGVFCSESGQGVKVEVACLSLFSRDYAAKTLFSRL